MEEYNIWLISGAIVIGLTFGGVVQSSGLCLVSAISNLILMRDHRQLHGFLAAVAVAMLGTLLLEWNGLVAVADTSYRNASLNWVGAAGGVVFGFGAIFAGGCNIGNGLTGMSTCSSESLLALAAMLMGMRIGLAWLSRSTQTAESGLRNSRL